MNAIKLKTNEILEIKIVYANDVNASDDPRNAPN